MSAYLVFALGSVFLLPMVIGVFALREINRCREPMRGRWFAIASIILGQAGIMVAVIAFGLLGAGLESDSAPVITNLTTLKTAAAAPVPPKMDPAKIRVMRKALESNFSLAEAAFASDDTDGALTYLELAQASALSFLPEEKTELDRRASALKHAVTMKQAQKKIERELKAADEALARNDLDAARNPLTPQNR